MMPPIGTNDIVAQEEDRHDYISTNLIWMRRGPDITKLWDRVLHLERDGTGTELSRVNKVGPARVAVAVAGRSGG